MSEPAAAAVQADAPAIPSPEVAPTPAAPPPAAEPAKTGLMALPEPPTDAPQEPEPPYRPAPGLMHVEELIMRATSRDRIAEALLWFCEGRFTTALLLTVHGDHADAWRAQGENLDDRKAASLSIDLSEPSLLQSARDSGKPAMHEVPQTPIDRRLLAFLGMHPRSHTCAVPIVVKGRIVNMLYGTRGTWPMRETILGELERIAILAARAYDRLLLAAKNISG